MTIFNTNTTTVQMTENDLPAKASEIVRVSYETLCNADFDISVASLDVAYEIAIEATRHAMEFLSGDPDRLEDFQREMAILTAGVLVNTLRINIVVSTQPGGLRCVRSRCFMSDSGQEATSCNLVHRRVRFPPRPLFFLGA